MRDVLDRWENLDPALSVEARLGWIAEDLGVAKITVRRYLTRAHKIGNQESKPKPTKTERLTARVVGAGLSQRILDQARLDMPTADARELGIGLAAGAMLADIMAGQRRSLDRLERIEQQLLGLLDELAHPPLGEALDEGVLHRAATTYARLVQAVQQRQQAVRDAWGIRLDAGPGSYSDALDALPPPDTPHPSDTPPNQLQQPQEHTLYPSQSPDGVESASESTSGQVQ